MLPVLMGTLGAAKIVTGYRSEVGSARSQRKAGEDSLLTARYNINQRKLNSRQTKFSIIESGQAAATQVQKQAQIAEATAMTEAGSSGAQVGSGTPRAVLTNIAQEGTNAVANTVLNTRNMLKTEDRQVLLDNTSEWNQANAYASGMKRDAKRTMDNARIKLVSDIAETALSTYSAGSAGGTKKFSWGLETAKTAKTISRQRNPEEAFGGRGRGQAKSSQRYRSNPVKKHSLYETTKQRIVDWKEGRRSFDLDRLFSPSAWKSASAYTREKKWSDPLGKAYQFATGTGLSGKAAPKKFNYGSRRD